MLLLSSLGFSPSSSPAIRARRRLPQPTMAASEQKHVVVIGGGWAGYAAADALSASSDCRVTLLEASPRAAGGLAAGWRTPGGRPVEAGIHGFWREYRNTLAVLDSLGLDADEVLTPFTPTRLVSRTGNVAVAPVLNAGGPGASPAPAIMRPPPLSPDAALQRVAELLPAPLDTALLAEFDPSSPLTLADRASAIGLLACWADFLQEDDASWARYDGVSAEELFKRYGGVSDALYEEMVSPLLHVLPMAPGYDVSAAAALSCFHVFALQSRGAFDVRWCRGAISEKIFAPWQTQLEARGNVELRGGARVGRIGRLRGPGVEGKLSIELVPPPAAPPSSAAAAAGAAAEGGAAEKPFEEKLAMLRREGAATIARREAIAAAGPGLVLVELDTEAEEAEAEAAAPPATITADAVVLAVGGTSAARLAAASPETLGALQATSTWEGLRGVTCVAVRLYLQPSKVTTAGLGGGAHGGTRLPPAVAQAMAASPVVVCGPGVGGLPELTETGFCVYDLQRMHDEFAADGSAAVLEVDFYRADAIADLDDDAAARLALQAAAAALGLPAATELPPSLLLDYAVVRARRAVSHFDVGSCARSPPVALADGGGGGGGGGGAGSGLFVCGDWVDRAGHASWSTEKAVVTGRQAAEAVARELNLDGVDSVVIPAAEDTPQLSALRALAKTARSLLAPLAGSGSELPPPAPWALLRRK